MGASLTVAYTLGGVLQLWFGRMTDRFGRKAMLHILSCRVAVPWVMAGPFYVLPKPVPSGIDVGDVQKH